MLIDTITSCVFSTFLTPKIFSNKITSKAIRAIDFVKLESTSIKTYKYALSPTSEKALLRSRESQSPIPAIVPNKGPKALSI